VSPLLLGGLALGGLLVWKASHKKTASGGSSACDALCDAAQKATGVPVDACKQGAMYRACVALGNVSLFPSDPCSRDTYDAAKCATKIQGACPPGMSPVRVHTTQTQNTKTALGGSIGGSFNAGMTSQIDSIATQCMPTGTAHPPPSGDMPTSSGSVSCDPGQMPPPGYTWDPSGIVRRLRIGETPVACGGSTITSSGASRAGHADLLAIF
jgi:hypothetical protein